MSIYIPYTYLIGWTHHNKYYYGVRYRKECTPSDLWTTYFTSSLHVSDFRSKYGEPDIIQVRQCFLNKNQAKKWEEAVLTRLKVSSSDTWLNVSEGNKFRGVTGEKRNTSKMGRYIRTDEVKAKYKSSRKYSYGENNPLFNKGHTPESILKMKEAKKDLMWVTNGTQSKRIKNHLPVPEGWVRGR